MRLKSCLNILLAVGVSVLAACGQFTNIPAQIKLLPTAEIQASVNYTVEADKVSVAVKNPKIALEGEAGSIGVTYDTLTIEYKPDTISLNPRVITIATSVRVPSSHQFDKDGQVIQAKSAEFELPVVSSNVVELGNPLAATRVNSQISAKVTLQGLDDALFPAFLEVSVPINFITSGLPR